MRKDLAAARTLAAEQHDLEYFKEILKAFMEAREADKRAKEALKAEKQAKKAAGKKEKKSAAKVVEEDEDADLEMADAIGDPESDGAEANEPTKTNKRKAEDVSYVFLSLPKPMLIKFETPQGSDSVKKPRTTIKLNTKKELNGASTPKTPKEATPKTAKPKKAKPDSELADGHSAHHWRNKYNKQLDHSKQLEASNAGRRVKMQGLEKEAEDARHSEIKWASRYAALAASINTIALLTAIPVSAMTP